MIKLKHLLEGMDMSTVQAIVDRIYPKIVKNLGKSSYGNKIPSVELHRDIYARISGIEGMEGEHSKTSKAEYVQELNIIYIYYPNMIDEEDIIRTLLHEYTHSLQDPTKWAEYREKGYENNPYEIAANNAENNWKKYIN